MSSTSPSTDQPGVRYEVDDPVAVITLDRPDTLNAFTFDMVRAIRERVADAVADRRVVGIVITGTGRGFCVGLDSSAVKATTKGEPVPAGVTTGGRLPGMFSYLVEQPKPIIAAVNGVTAGGGYILATMCDLRFASTDATFVTVFSKRGLTAELGISWTMSRLVGTGNALDLLWSSRKIDAAEALRLGLVERVTEPERLLDTAKSYIAELAEQVSPASIASIKRLVWDGAGMEMSPALRQALEATQELMVGPDAREGAAAFIERRAPQFARLGG